MQMMSPLVGLVSAGLTGLGVPYVLAIGLWALAVLTAVTFGQRVWAVRQPALPATAPPTTAPVTPGSRPTRVRTTASSGSSCERSPAVRSVLS